MLSIVVLWLAVYLTGMLLCKTGREKGASQLWIHLTGFFFLFFIQGIVFTAAQFLGFGFGQACQLLAGLLAGISLLAAIICHRELAEKLAEAGRFWKKRRENGRGLYYGLAGWLWLGIFLVLFSDVVGNRQDALLETMQTSLATDTINQIHPFTGQPMELGIILAKKILTLPFWYGALCQWTGFSPQDTVWVWGSFFTITFSLMAFSELAGLLFERNFKRTWLFAILLELLILSGDYFTGTAGYQLLFYGYTGETIVGAVALPMLLTLLYRLLAPLFQKEERFCQKRERLGLWSALLKLGMIFGAAFFLAPVLWGVGFLTIGAILFVICLAGAGLIKKYVK